MIIIFEGMDRCGKDTQIDLLKKKELFDTMHVIHDKGPGKNATADMAYAYVTQQVEQISKMPNVIMNRSAIGEIVWGKLFRNYDIDKAMLHDIAQFIDDMIIFILVDSSNGISEREDGNSLPKNDTERRYVREAFQNARNVLKGWGFCVHYIDICDKSIEQVQTIIDIELHDFTSRQYKDVLDRIRNEPHIDNGTREWLDAHVKFRPFFNFNLSNESYIKHELDWYLSMDRNIKGHPGIENNKVWKACATDHGDINSNYGWCVFSEENFRQYLHAIKSLEDDKNTRQSTCIYTRPSIQKEHNDGINAQHDFICTYATQHFIRNNALEYIVYMRSNDAWYGLRNDFAWHRHVYIKMYYELLDRYPDLQVGSIHWNAGSLHLYDCNLVEVK